MTARRFTLYSLVGTACLLISIGLFNAVVDPYNVYGFVSIPGVNRDKTQAADQSRLTKPYLVERARPATLILGSSRIELGFDPDSKAWPAAMRPVFNLGIAGSGPDEQYQILQHALTVVQPKYIFIGISFVDAWTPPTHRLSGVAPPPNQSAYAQFEARLKVTPDGRPNPHRAWALVDDAVTTLLSLDALSDSIRTILNQGDSNVSRMTSLGLRTAGAFRALIHSDGEYNMFVDKVRVKADEIIPWIREPRFEVRNLARAIALAQRHDAAVTVVIAPVNAAEMEIYRLAGAINLYNDWRNRVSDVVAAAARHGPVSLWDFSAVSPYTTEPLPPSSDRSTQPRWFWEANHFTTQLGDVVIERIFGHGASDFGTEVTADTLPAIVANERALRKQYEAAHPQDVKRIADLYEAQLRRACQSDPFFCHPPTAVDNDVAAAEQAPRRKLP